MTSIWKEDYELMDELKDYATTYVTYVRSGGHVGDFPDSLINKTIAICMKLKSNRDYIFNAMDIDIPSERQECDTAISILSGNYKDSRLNDVIKKVYTNY